MSDPAPLTERAILTCEACGADFPEGQPGSFRDEEECDVCPACGPEEFDEAAAETAR